MSIAATTSSAWAWWTEGGNAALEEMRRRDHVFAPGRYVGAPLHEDDNEPFEDKMKRPAAHVRDLRNEGARPDAAIAANLETLGFGES